jgi:hypothetical protein
MVYYFPKKNFRNGLREQQPVDGGPDAEQPVRHDTEEEGESECGPVSDREKAVDGVGENERQAEIKGGDSGDPAGVCALAWYSC